MGVCFSKSMAADVMENDVLPTIFKHDFRAEDCSYCTLDIVRDPYESSESDFINVIVENMASITKLKSSKSIEFIHIGSNTNTESWEKTTQSTTTSNKIYLSLLYEPQTV